MVFNPKRLAVLANAEGFSMFRYRATDQLLEDVFKDNYFGRGDYLLTVGDLIVVSASNGTRIVVVTVSDLQTVITERLS